MVLANPTMYVVLANPSYICQNSYLQVKFRHQIWKGDLAPCIMPPCKK